MLNIHAGGRYLNAIKANNNFDGYETSVMLYLGGCLDFRKSFLQPRPATYSALCRGTKFSESTIRRAIKRLVKNGYLKVRERFDSVSGRQKANAFSLTSKVFNEYKTILRARLAKRRAQAALAVKSTKSKAEKAPSKLSKSSKGKSTNPLSRRDTPNRSETTPRSPGDTPRSCPPLNSIPPVNSRPSCDDPFNGPEKGKTAYRGNLPKARAILESIFQPTSERIAKVKAQTGRAPFVLPGAIRRLAENCLTDYGLPVLEEVERGFQAQGLLGEMDFNQRKFRAICEQVREELKR